MAGRNHVGAEFFGDACCLVRRPGIDDDDASPSSNCRKCGRQDFGEMRGGVVGRNDDVDGYGAGWFSTLGLHISLIDQHSSLRFGPRRQTKSNAQRADTNAHAPRKGKPMRCWCYFAELSPSLCSCSSIVDSLSIGTRRAAKSMTSLIAAGREPALIAAPLSSLQIGHSVSLIFANLFTIGQSKSIVYRAGGRQIASTLAKPCRPTAHMPEFYRVRRPIQAASGPIEPTKVQMQKRGGSQ